jgi:hypothetical protein
MIILISDIKLTMQWPQGTQAAGVALKPRVAGFFYVLSIFHPCVFHVLVEKWWHNAWQIL